MSGSFGTTYKQICRRCFFLQDLRRRSMVPTGTKLSGGTPDSAQYNGQKITDWPPSFSDGYRTVLFTIWPLESADVADCRWLAITLDCPELCVDRSVNYSRGHPVEPKSGIFARTIVGLSDAHRVLPRPAYLLLFVPNSFGFFWLDFRWSLAFST
jgi:hypothetical protein